MDPQAQKRLLDDFLRVGVIPQDPASESERSGQVTAHENLERRLLPPRDRDHEVFIACLDHAVLVQSFD